MHGVNDWLLAVLAEEVKSATGFTDWWDKWGGEAIAGLIVVAVSAIGTICYRWITRHSVTFWARLTWLLHFRVGFWWRQHRSRKNARIICLEEYISELASARDKVVSYVRKIGAQRCKIRVQVFTQQLPSDWPLWFGGASDEILRTTPLGRYILEFSQFVDRRGRYEGLQVEVIRYIVVDKIDSPHGEGVERRRKLIEDMGQAWCQRYITLLHGQNGAGARVLEYPGVWPGWLTDCVFFGLLVTDAPANQTEWLFGFTTSYNPGEDVIIYRYHYLPSPGSIPEDLPEGVVSLGDMPDSAGLQDRARPLAELLHPSQAS